jgi:hypothetical protein
MRYLILLVVIVMALSPLAASADTLFMPALNAGTRDWFTTADVLAWSAEAQNVMPIYCTELRPGVFESCIVEQAQPLTLVWSDEQGKVIAK